MTREYWVYADDDLLDEPEPGMTQVVMLTDYAALRARCTELEQAIEVIQSSRDICLNTFTAWCTEQYGPAKHALRMEPEYKKRIEALEQALDGLVDVIRVLYNMDRIYPTSHEEQLALGAKLGLAYQQALAQREVKA